MIVLSVDQVQKTMDYFPIFGIKNIYMFMNTKSSFIFFQFYALCKVSNLIESDFGSLFNSCFSFLHPNLRVVSITASSERRSFV